MLHFRLALGPCWVRRGAVFFARSCCIWPTVCCPYATCHMSVNGRCSSIRRSYLVCIKLAHIYDWFQGLTDFHVMHVYAA